MLTESGGWRSHLERRAVKSSVMAEGGAGDSSIIEGLIMQKRKSVKKFQVAQDSEHSVIN